jgi:hypothetical protein
MTPFISLPPRGEKARTRQIVLGFAWAAAILGAPPTARSEPPSPPAILQELRAFREMGSVLYVAAHPDDENTQLITYLRAAETIAQPICP